MRIIATNNTNWPLSVYVTHDFTTDTLTLEVTSMNRDYWSDHELSEYLYSQLHDRNDEIARLEAELTQTKHQCKILDEACHIRAAEINRLRVKLDARHI